MRHRAEVRGPDQLGVLLENAGQPLGVPGQREPGIRALPDHVRDVVDVQAGEVLGLILQAQRAEGPREALASGLLLFEYAKARALR